MHGNSRHSRRKLQKDSEKVATDTGVSPAKHRDIEDSYNVSQSLASSEVPEVSGDIPRRHLESQPETSYTSAVLDELLEDIREEQPRCEGVRTGTCGDSVSPWPMPSISSSDKVYVQGKNGFASLARSKLFQSSSPDMQADNDNERTARDVATPLEFAIELQQYTRKFYTMCHGLLGGFSLAHCILVLSIGTKDHELTLFTEVYPYMSLVVHSLYFFIAVICFVSILDRCDFRHTSLVHMGDLECYWLSNIILLLLYLFVLVATTVAVSWDNRLVLQPYNNGTLWANPEETYAEFTTWRKLSLCRGTAAILGWGYISVSAAEDMLSLHLTNMIKYQQPSKTTKQCRF